MDPVDQASLQSTFLVSDDNLPLEDKNTFAAWAFANIANAFIASALWRREHCKHLWIIWRGTSGKENKNLRDIALAMRYICTSRNRANLNDFAVVHLSPLSPASSKHHMPHHSDFWSHGPIGMLTSVSYGTQRCLQKARLAHFDRQIGSVR